MGGDLIPMLVAPATAHFYDFADNDVPGATDRDRGYWRDVGTLDSYYHANMDLVSVHPVFNLYNRRVADLHRRIPAAAGQVRLRGRLAAPAGRWTRSWAPGSSSPAAPARRSVLSPGVLIESRSGRRGLGHHE